MKFFEKIRNIKLILIAVAIVIAIMSLVTSNFLISDLQKEETNKMEVWAEAMRSYNQADETTDLSLVLKVINGNNTIPVVVLDSYGNVQASRNLGRTFEASEDSISIIKDIAVKMKRSNKPIIINLEEFDEDYFIEICYDESLMLKRLTVYPYIQLAIVIIFVVIALFALFSTMKAEQNKVWVGLSKETAHQLGTPISSLMAWTEVLRETHPDDELLPEMEKDVKRLQLIAERFSKIGSIPQPQDASLNAVINRVAEYMDRRTSSKVTITTHFASGDIHINMVESLFEWVIENLCKNAVDAMNGTGHIDIRLEQEAHTIAIEVSDTGKGMPKSHFKSVFKPGFTTKQRGWGLGLSLAKRIVEEYHKGSIFVKWSEVGHGTTFRIELPTTPTQAK
ncbi:MAG: HAMP domain-containing histidine kinase [Prevotellaceae bacterium]|nr:HAMP domain-containing histidine kinase [Candidatus Colivivens caballi]